MGTDASLPEAGTDSAVSIDSWLSPWVEGEPDVTVDGKTVARILWATVHMVVFEDKKGQAWRFVHARRRSWPVEAWWKPRDDGKTPA